LTLEKKKEKVKKSGEREGLLSSGFDLPPPERGKKEGRKKKGKGTRPRWLMRTSSWIRRSDAQAVAGREEREKKKKKEKKKKEKKKKGERKNERGFGQINRKSLRS